MSQLFQCSGGHRWEAGEAAGMDDTLAHSCCPECGQEGTTVHGALADEVTLAVDGRPVAPAQDVTVMLPGETPAGVETTLAQENANAAAPLEEHTLPDDSPAALIPDHLERTLDEAPGLGMEDPTRLDTRPGRKSSAAPDKTRADEHEATGAGGRAPSALRREDARYSSGGKRIPIAGYEILGELGRGAMGVVYKACQLRLNRVVALKMILAGGHASTTELARFRTEAEAVARLDHANIVQVYEVGEHEGNPYFSLEYVDGESLQKKVDGTPQPARLAAEVTRSLASAMHAAHQRGIIHRDLKPANVLLTQAGVPKITDFGLAKRIDDRESGTTRTGAILGTPSYMAPEQAQGRTKETGPEADIYSLGAILYDLLAGRPPFRGETVLDTLQQVQTAEPIPPSRLAPRVPRDLETICLKALAKEPHRRYGSAGALAEDLDRFLRSLPILARPTPWWERALKWIRRHPTGAALGAVSALAVVSVLAFGALWLDTRRRAAEEREEQQAFQAASEHALREQADKLKEQADRARDEAIKQQQRAETNFQSAQDAVNQMLTAVGHEQLAYEPRMEQIRRDLLVKALAFYERFLKEKSTDPAIRLQTGRAQLRAAEIHEMLGEHDPAEKAFRAALTLLQGDQAPEFRREWAAASNNLGNLLRQTGRVGFAEQAYKDALRARQDLVTGFPGQPDYRFDLAGSYNNLGLVLNTLGRNKEADDAFAESEKLLSALDAEYPSRAAYAQELARCQNNRGTALAALGKTADAARAYDQAQKTLSKLADAFPAVPDYWQELAVTQKHVGDLLRDVQPRQAEDAYREALKTRQRLVKDFPSVPLYRQQEAASHADLAVLLQATGRQKDADLEYAEALALRERVAQEFPRVPDFRRTLGSTYNNRGNALLTSSRLREAQEAYSRAFEFLSKLVADHPEVPDYALELAKVHVNLGSLFSAVQQFRRAEDSYQQALKLQQDLVNRFPGVPDYRNELWTSHLNLANVLQMTGKLPEAEKLYQKAVAGFGQLARELPRVPDYRHELAVSLNNLATLLLATKRAKESEQARKEGIQVLAQLAAELPEIVTYRQELARARNDLGILLATTGRSAEAIALWEQVREDQTAQVKASPDQPPCRIDLATTCRNLGAAQVKANELEAAEKHFRKAISVLEELVPKLPPSPPYYGDLIVNHQNLANLLTALDRPEDAIKSRTRVVELWEKLAAAYPTVAEFRRQLASSLHVLAKQLFENDDQAEALRDVRKAITRQQDLVRAAPADAAAAAKLLEYRLDLLFMLVETGDHAAAVSETNGLDSLKTPSAGRDNQQIAGLLARCVALVQKDGKLSEAHRQELARNYGDRAMAFLRRTREAGFTDVNALKNSRDFDPLRSREDFQQMLRMRK
jgi:serine/threonine-protein kinase